MAQSLSLSLLRKASDLVCSWPMVSLELHALLGGLGLGSATCDSMGVANPVTDTFSSPTSPLWAEGCSLQHLYFLSEYVPGRRSLLGPCTRQAGSALGLMFLEAALIQDGVGVDEQMG